MDEKSFGLYEESWKKAGKNALIFAGPAILAGLFAYQQGWDLKVALTAFSIALYGLLVDLFKKWLKDNN